MVEALCWATVLPDAPALIAEVIAHTAVPPCVGEWIGFTLGRADGDGLRGGSALRQPF